MGLSAFARTGWGVLGLVLALVFPAGPVAADPAPCPPGLEAAAELYRQGMNREQAEIRTSTRENPRGVEPTTVFDRASHGCHRAPGQAYREFGPPECLEPVENGRVPVRLPYRLFFRKALTLEDLFEQEWQPGSDGVLLVTFEQEGDRWIPVARREVLDLGSGPGEGKDWRSRRSGKTGP